MSSADSRRLNGSPEAPVRVNQPCAWYGRDLREDSSWIWPLDDVHRQELDDALRQSKARGLGEQSVRREDFPLPTLSALLQKMLHELEHGRGFVLMRGIPVERYDYADLRRLYWGIGTHIGSAQSQNIKGELIQEITDLGFDYSKSEHRGSMTSAELRPHCDITDLVALLCIRPARSGGASTIRSAMTIYNEILDQHPEYLPALHRGFHFELDGKGPTGAPDEVTHRIPVFSWHQGYLACRFNQKAIEGGAVKADTPLTELEQAAVDCVGRTAVRSDVELSMSFQPGDIQWLNNHVILHSRTAFEDHQDAQRKRLLLRLWLNHPGARPLDYDFANKALNGPRKGVMPRGATYRPEDLRASA
ncbi:MAG: TauD/TfdA family dioxygenase [Gammaproteobacteria bacterium]|nr:TauD/TfdA family dioxygenase [Gammaproteobacteria bacterium]